MICINTKLLESELTHWLLDRANCELSSILSINNTLEIDEGVDLCKYVRN